MTAVHTRGIVAALAALALAACGPSQGAVETSPTPQTATTSESDRAAIERARADSARNPYTEADIQFMSAMIGHHAQAIDMARLVPERTTSGQIRTLAGRIINAQQDDIRLMQTWLRDRGQPVPEARADVHHAHDGGPPMHGMLSEAQMAELQAARGAEFDRLFLRFMIQHHRGAVTMVQDLIGSHGAAQDDTVFKLAADVNVDQTTEINRMEQMLLTLILERGSQ